MALDNYKNLEPFRFWCQTVLPSVYDDSLSYYELLCKVVAYLNTMGENVDTLHDVVEDYTQRFAELKSYVDNYFENLNVQEEINAKLDEMAASGALSALLEPFIPALVSNWLEENIESTTPPVDATLSVSGAAADAKTVGDKLLNGRAMSDIELMPDARYIGALPAGSTPLILPNNTWIRTTGAILKAMLSGSATFTWLDELSDAVSYILERRFSAVSGVSAWAIRQLGGNAIYTGYNLAASIGNVVWSNRRLDATLSFSARPADAKAVGDHFYAGRNRDENTPIPTTIYSPPTVPDGWESDPEWDTSPEQCVITQMPLNSRFRALGSILLAYLPNDFPWRDEIKTLTTYHIECRAYGTSTYAKEFHIHAINSGSEYYGWNMATHPAPYWHKLQPEKVVKILFIGNSYTEDSVVYSPFLVRSLAPDVLFTIGISYISGGQTVDYEDSFDNDTDTPTYFKIKGTETAWTNRGRKTIKQILADEQWDMIFFNGVSIDEGSNPPTFVDFNGFLDKIVKYKMQSQTTPIRYGYLNTQVRVGGTGVSFEEAKIRANIILNTTPLNCLIPCGTAVEIARTTSLDSLGDYGHLAEDSNGHMQEGLPRLLTAYVTTLSLLSFVGVDWRGIMGETTRPDSDFPTTINVPGRQGNVTGVNDDNCILAQKCAIAAVKKPFEISDII